MKCEECEKLRAELKIKDAILKSRISKKMDKSDKSRETKGRRIIITIVNTLYEFEKGIISDKPKETDKRKRKKKRIKPLNVSRLVKMINAPIILKNRDNKGLPHIAIKSSQHIKPYLDILVKDGTITLKPLKLTSKGLKEFENYINVRLKNIEEVMNL